MELGFDHSDSAAPLYSGMKGPILNLGFVIAYHPASTAILYGGWIVTLALAAAGGIYAGHYFWP